MAELFHVFGDAKWARWAKGIQNFTELDADYVSKIREAARKVQKKERDRIQRELPQIGTRLTERITDKG